MREDNAALRCVIQSLIETTGALCLSAGSVVSALSLVKREAGFTHLLKDWRVDNNSLSPLINCSLEQHEGIDVAICTGCKKSDVDPDIPADAQVRYLRKSVAIETLTNWLKS